MPTGAFNHPLFGHVTYKTEKAEWKRGDDITFLSGFDIKDIQPVTIPQLAHINGTHDGRMQFHKRAHKQIQMAFEDAERLDLLKYIKTCEGSLAFRLRKPTDKSLSTKPSNHAFGIAIDLNADDGSLGASIAPLAPVFKALGFTWGMEFNDPMHFEVNTFIDHPRSIVSKVTVKLNDKDIDIGALNLMGELVADIDKAATALNIPAMQDGASRAMIQGIGQQDVVPLRRIGAIRYTPLAQLVGAIELTMRYDNDKKLAQLTRPA